MALNICIEAMIRLFLEIINFIFGDITLLFRGHPEALWTIVLPEMLKTIAWVFIFYLIKYIARSRIVSYILIIGLPLVLTWIAHALSTFIASLIATPLIGAVVGFVIASPLLMVSGLLSAVAWGFLAITDDTVPLYLRIVGMPGMMVLGLIAGSIGPFGWLMAAGAVAGLTVAAGVIIPLSTLAVILITWWSPSFFCEKLNSTLKLLENIRQEGLIEGIKGSLVIIPVLIKKRIIKLYKER